MAVKIPRLGTILEYALISVPLFIFVLSPLLSVYFPSLSSNVSSSISSSYRSFERSDTLVIPDPNLACDAPAYQVRILSREPLVIYVEDFLTRAEADHLVDISQPLFAPSTIHTGDSETFDPSIRNSSKALLPRDHTVQCIEQRAREFQGWRPHVFIERLWVQKYETGGHYTYHFDWSGDLKSFGGGRLSTFMVYLGEDGVVGGGTKFPRLAAPAAQKWCEFIECSTTDTASGDSWEENPENGGVIFKPIKGNAVYWENFAPDGRGYEETWHAGLPVEKGTKYGLNIWSWYQPGYLPPTSHEESSYISQSTNHP